MLHLLARTCAWRFVNLHLLGSASPWTDELQAEGRELLRLQVTGVDLLSGASGEDGLSSTCTRTRGQNGFIILRLRDNLREGLPGTGYSRL